MNGWLFALSLVLPAGEGFPQSAAVRKIAREIVESFGRETLERAEARVVAIVDAYGDDAVRALRRTGPAGVHAVEKYGAHGVRVLSRWGDDGARLLASEGDEVVAALAKYGDDAVDLMLRHPGIGGNLLEQFGEHALRTRISSDGAVTLGRLAEPIRASGRVQEIFNVVERFGDRACAFLWRHKGKVFAAAVLASFLSDPQPYLDGVKDLLGPPLAEAAREAGQRADWTLLGLAAMGLVAAAVAMRRLRRAVARRPDLAVNAK